MSCPQESLPPGWRVWRGSVPRPLQQFAIEVRDHVRQYPYGTIAQVVQWEGRNVGAWVSHHVWTYRGGVLITGICIPGVSLVRPIDPREGVLPPQDLTVPDPEMAMYGADHVVVTPPSRGPTPHPILTVLTITSLALGIGLGVRSLVRGHP